MEKLKLLTIKKKGKNMNRNLGTYAINREKESYNCSITCEELGVTTKINAINALDQVEQINATIRNFEKQLGQEKIIQITTKINAINALDQVEKINATIRNFEKELKQEKIMQMHAATGKFGQEKEIINN